MLFRTHLYWKTFSLLLWDLSSTGILILNGSRELPDICLLFFIAPDRNDERCWGVTNDKHPNKYLDTASHAWKDLSETEAETSLVTRLRFGGSQTGACGGGCLLSQKLAVEVSDSKALGQTVLPAHSSVRLSLPSVAIPCQLTQLAYSRERGQRSLLCLWHTRLTQLQVEFYL